LCGKHSAYVESNYFEFIEQASLYYERLEIVEDLNKVTEEIIKVTICDFINPETNSFPFFG
jgi:hypothetical protein